MANVPGRGLPPKGGGGRRTDLLKAAIVALNGDRPVDAQRLAAKVLKADPGNPLALHVIGSALVVQGRVQEAIAPLETAARSLQDPKIETLLAIALRKAGRTDEAISWFRRATTRQPPQAQAFYELGSLFCSLERFDEAAEVLRRGSQIAPMVGAFPMQLGYALLRSKNYAEAKREFARALQMSPNIPDGLLGMAKVHLSAGEIAPAADYFRRYLAVRPNDQSVRLHLGHCLLELGHADEGSEFFRQAAVGDPRNLGEALSALVKSGHGRFWLKRSAAERFFKKPKLG
jgi:Flp pilus assembly protein TadD